jgi:hypothetical protein
MGPSKQSWTIRGYDSSKTIYEKEVDRGQLTDVQVEALLKALVATCALTFDEIVGAYARKRTKISNDLLVVQRSSNGREISCGTNPHFIAIKNGAT